MHPCSGSRSWGKCERTLVPVFVPGEHPNVPFVPVLVPPIHTSKQIVVVDLCCQIVLQMSPQHELSFAEA